jgi:hypothetical protein
VIPTALVLKQEGRTVTGTIALPTQHVGQRVEVELTGEFADGSLTLSGTVQGAAEPTTLTLTATLKDDGSLEGRLSMRDHNLPWTAERLKERKLLYGSPMGDSNLHNHRRVTLFLAGRAGGALQGGLHLAAANGTPLANVMLGVLRALGCEALDRFGDSTAVFDLNGARD